MDENDKQSTTGLHSGSSTQAQRQDFFSPGANGELDLPGSAKKITDFHDFSYLIKRFSFFQ